MVETKERVKDALERKEIKVGDFVTINDDSDVIEAYVVKQIHGSTATIYALELTYERDDIVVAEKIIALSELIYIGDVFVCVNGFLWEVREQLLKGRPIDVPSLLRKAI